MSESLESVGPVLDPIFTEILKILAFIVAHAEVRVLVSLLNSVLYAVELVETNHDGTAFTY